VANDSYEGILLGRDRLHKTCKQFLPDLDSFTKLTCGSTGLAIAMASRLREENDMKDFFGTIHPDVSQIQFGKEMTGKVFRLKIDTVGPFHRGRRLEIDLQAWEDCQQCKLYHSYYEFSIGKLLMQQFMVQIQG
jgi:hypothetical protein